MKNFSLLIFIGVLISLEASHAGDTLGECHFSIPQILSEKNSWLAGCPNVLLSSGSTEDLEKNYKKNLNSKLSKSLALQTRQILSDLGTVSDYFEQSNKSFLMGKDSDIAKSCRFDGFINSIEKKGCSGNGSTPEEKERLKMLADALGGDYKSNSLWDSFLHVYGQNKYGAGFENSSMNQCPLNGNAFPLNSQITKESASTIINEFNLENNNFNKEKTYDKYPQLAMIKEAEKYNPGFQADFEKYIRAYNPEKNNPKDYFSAFFFSEKNQAKLASGVARRCRQVQASISSFACHPLISAIPKDSLVSKKLFDGYDTNKPFDAQSTKVKNLPTSRDVEAYKCYSEGTAKVSSLEKVAPSSSSTALAENNPDFCLNLTKEQNTVDNYYRCFNDGVRPEGVGGADNSNIENFCSMYSCKNSIVENTPSCKAGGPLSSFDLENLKLKDDNISNQVAYIKSLEKHAKDKADFLAMMNSAHTGEPIKVEVKKSMSEFDLNAFGSDAVTKFLGLPQTPIVLAQMSQDMKDRGITPSTPEQIQKIVNREPVQSNEEMFGRDLAQNNQQIIPTTNTASANYTGNSFMTPTPSSDSTRITGVHSNKSTSDLGAVSGSNTADEVAQMKKDLKALSDNAQAAPSRAIASEPEESSNTTTSKYDQDYARDLASKDKQLKQREREVVSRENTVWAREREAQRREEELNRKEKEMDESKGHTGEASVAAAAVASGGAALGSNTDARSAKLAQDKEDLKASHNGLTVTPDKLQKLDKEDLVNLGVNIEAPFIIRVKVGDKLVSVRVAKVKKENGEAYLEPFMNEDSKEVRSAILRSPIFREFRYHLDQKQSSYSPVKKLKKE